MNTATEPQIQIPIPTLADCIRLHEKYGMLDNIRRHSIVVARLALVLRNALAERQPGLPQAEPALVVAGGLLHDIAKTPCLNGKCSHVEVGTEICLAEGYPDIAWIVAQHVQLDPFDEAAYREGEFSAAVLVHYADKRVRHHEIVPLQDRLEYIYERYGKKDPVRLMHIDRHFQQYRVLEALLFRWLPFPPEALAAE